MDPRDSSDARPKGRNNRVHSTSPRLLSSNEAAARLGVKLPTLYAYVSRGLVRRHIGPDGRSSRFETEQIEDLARKGRPRRSSFDPNVEILVHSSITRIPDGPAQRFGHLYRGQRATALAKNSTFEDVAGLLIGGRLGAIAVHVRATRSANVTPDPLGAMRIELERAASTDQFRSAVDGDALLAVSANVLATVISTAAGSASPRPRSQPTARPSTPPTAAAHLATGLSTGGAPAPWVIDAVNAALILLADHELAPSALAARLAASTRTDPYRCVIAALATLSGPLHGGASSQVRLALDFPDPVHRRSMLQGHGSYAGFGHPLYADTDPRAKALLDCVGANAPDHPATIAATQLATTVFRESGLRPNVDLGMAALTAAGSLRADAGSVIFAVARTAGWLAHIAEEYQARPLRFRPRAVPR